MHATSFSGEVLSRMMRIVIVASSLGLLAGCASSSQRAPLATGDVQADQSRVYVYCISGIGAKPAKISDGDSVIGNLGPHSYVCWDRSPGKTVIRARLPHGRGVWGDAKAELQFDLTAGQTNYVQAGVFVPFYVVISPIAGQAATKFSLVSKPQKEAMADIAKECKPPGDSGASRK
jgi:hypothetical protein